MQCVHRSHKEVKMASTYGSKETPTAIKVIRSITKAINAVSPNLAGYLAYQLFCTPMNRAKTELELNPRQIRVPHKGGYLVGYEWAGTGKTIMLVHGWEASAGRFKKLIKLLVEQNYHVIAMDAPAHGASSGRQTNPLDYSDGLYAFAKSIGDVDTIIAHSFGSPTTMVLLDKHADFKVNNVVLIGAPNRIVDVFRMFAGLIQLPEKGFERMKYHLERSVGEKADDFNTATVAATRSERALIVHDVDDNIVTVDNGRAIAKAWANAHYYETENLGHRRILNHSETLNYIIGWIEKS